MPADNFLRATAAAAPPADSFCDTGASEGFGGTRFAANLAWESPQFRGEIMMKKSTLLVALSAASLASGLAFAQTQPQNQPYSQTKPATPPPAMDSNAQSGGFSMSQLDKNKDGVVDRAEAKASASLTAIFDKADTNKDGKLDAAELSAASHMSSTTK
ncbi:MAG TPA: hypothetical protein VJ501_11245 [Burkholderiaceae bacterium]|nr:hypothetical protein [Burkholderiaceae bacterium]